MENQRLFIRNERSVSYGHTYTDVMKLRMLSDHTVSQFNGMYVIAKIEEKEGTNHKKIVAVSKKTNVFSDFPFFNIDNGIEEKDLLGVWVDSKQVKENLCEKTEDCLCLLNCFEPVFKNVAPAMVVIDQNTIDEQNNNPGDDQTQNIDDYQLEIIECPECLRKVSQHELDMFGGWCEECSTEL